MTSKMLKVKVLEYINKDNVLEVVYNMLKIYEDDDGKSQMIYSDCRFADIAQCSFMLICAK